MKRLAAGLEVRTTDLRPGDVLMYADLVDTIVSVSDLGGCVMRVDVIRNERVCHWFAGKRAKHVLAGQAFCSCPRAGCEFHGT